MARGLDGFIYFHQCYPVAGCAVLRGRRDSREFPVALAKGKHLFPFRTEKLSLSAPMVLGPQGPGRVGRRRFTCTGSRSARSGSLSLSVHLVLQLGCPLLAAVW